MHTGLNFSRSYIRNIGIDSKSHLVLQIRSRVVALKCMEEDLGRAELELASSGEKLRGGVVDLVCKILGHQTIGVPNM